MVTHGDSGGCALPHNQVLPLEEEPLTARGDRGTARGPECPELWATDARPMLPSSPAQVCLLPEAVP